ncbi:MAG: aminodeoxychorismate/anthranilate synthase component II [Myxococcales bacterium]|nr:aminodeoxychorismate/anthranilate synthase component II [Myxococcales bacterium]
MGVLVVDNYDSFTFNLVQYLGELGAECEVVRNDARTVDEIAAHLPERILLSPGPCTPDDAGICLEVLARLAGRVPILGVCLGHQSIGQAFGGKVVRAPRLMHGRTSPISHAGVGVFRGLPEPMIATRYHSLIVERETLPAALEITAWTDDGLPEPTIMGLRHRTLPIEGVQFHPESILTVDGKQLLRNWLEG